MAEEEKPVPMEIGWEWAETPTIYANHLLVTHRGPEFYLVFGEIVPFNTDNPLNDLTKLKAQPRVRIAISREIMGTIVDAMVENYGNFSARVEAARKGQSDDKTP